MPAVPTAPAPKAKAPKAPKLEKVAIAKSPEGVPKKPAKAAKAEKAPKAPKPPKAIKEPKPQRNIVMAVSSDRSTQYEDVEVQMFDEDAPFTCQDAATLLGCQYPEQEGDTFSKYHFMDTKGRTVFCDNVHMQRPYYSGVAKALMNDILQGYWQKNLETIIVGETGMILDGKHRAIALILAGEAWEKNPGEYPYWTTEPTIEVLVAKGAKEDKHVVNTIGIGKNRTLADSLFASGVLGDLETKAAKKYARVAEFAIRLLWSRTGAKDNAYSPRIRHAEAFSFMESHETIIHCVKTIVEENNSKDDHTKLERLAPLGVCAGLLYLMGVVTEDEGKLYRMLATPSESALSFARIEEAEKFWLLLAHNEESVSAISTAIGKLYEKGFGTTDERIGVIVKGWEAWSKNGTVVLEDLKLKTGKDANGYRILLEIPVISGSIDSMED